MATELKVTICDFEDLPDWVDREDTRGGQDCELYLVIEDGDYLRVYCDAMEPEDARFSRDLGWIARELRGIAKRREDVNGPKSW